MSEDKIIAKFNIIEQEPIKVTFKAYNEPPNIGGTTNYNWLENKPKINDVELIGNKTLSELGIPLLTSQLENDSNFVTQTEVMQAIASIPQFKLSIVQELPLSGEKMVLYFVPKDGTDNDIYNEYIWIDETSSFEFLGTTAVDLTDYLTPSKLGINKVYPTTEDVYNSLETKDPNTLYLIEEE